MFKATEPELELPSFQIFIHDMDFTDLVRELPIPPIVLSHNSGKKWGEAKVSPNYDGLMVHIKLDIAEIERHVKDLVLRKFYWDRFK